MATIAWKKAQQYSHFEKGILPFPTTHKTQWDSFTFFSQPKKQKQSKDYNHSRLGHA